MMIESAVLQKICQKAAEIGFDAMGFTKKFVPEHKEYFLDWLKSGKQAEMGWLAKNLDKRIQPDRIFEDTRSVIVLATSYKHNKNDGKEFKIARYAHGEDYHRWVKGRLEKLAACIREEIDPQFKWRSFVDTGPVLERDLAAKAGLGWFGKNACLLNDELGSFIFLSVIFCNLDLPESEPVPDQCATCNLCIDSCPTDALTEYQLDARKCLAYHNIEKRGERDSKYWQALGNQLVGCDICQEVCPWNQKSSMTRNQDWVNGFNDYGIHDLSDFLKMTKSQYRKRFSKTAISRIQYEDFMRNVFLVIANMKKGELIEEVMVWRERNVGLELEEWRYCVEKLRARFQANRAL